MSDKNPQEAFTWELRSPFPRNPEDLNARQAGSGCGGCKRVLGFGEQRDDSVPIPQGHLGGGHSPAEGFAWGRGRGVRGESLSCCSVSSAGWEEGRRDRAQMR